jgi:hypothetical protein
MACAEGSARTWVGTETGSAAPLPICPSKLTPQHVTTPNDESRAHVCDWPAERAMACVRPETTTGVDESVDPPLPSCPTWFIPQQRAPPPDTSVGQLVAAFH